MNLEIREMRPEDYDQKGYIHYKAWQETYTGLMAERFISGQTLDKCQTIAHRWPQNTLVAELDGELVGYGCYHKNKSGSGEVIAIYLLRQFQGLGIGRKLIDALLEQLADCSSVSLWVLKGNHRAIGFYEHYGFRFDGAEKVSALGTELRMIYHY